MSKGTVPDKINKMSRLNTRPWVAIGFILFSVTFFFLIPYQIEKPNLLFGRALMDMEPTLFPRIATIDLCPSTMWFCP